MQTWNSLSCQSKGYGTQVTFKACGLLVVSTCMVSILFVFCLDSMLFNFVWSPEKGFPVFHHYDYWLPFYMGRILFPSTALSFDVYKTINKYILYLASYFNLIKVFSRQLNIGTLLFLLCLSAKHVHYMIWF